MINKKIWAMIAAGLLLFGFTGMVFAVDGQGPKDPEGFNGAPGMSQPGLTKMMKEFEKGLDDLIAVNVITAEQKGKIIEYFGKTLKSMPPADSKAMDEPKKEDKGPIGSLVQDGVINQAQAAVIIRVAPKPFLGPHRQIPADPEIKKTDLQRKLDGLVRSKVITVNQKDVILKSFTDKLAKAPDKKPGEEPGNNKAMKNGPDNFYVLLVQCNIITQKQADAIIAISEAMSRPMPMERAQGLDRPQTPPDGEK